MLEHILLLDIWFYNTEHCVHSERLSDIHMEPPKTYSPHR